MTASTVPTQNNRLYYMDSMRAVLMTLGIVLHTANIFSPTAQWAVQNPLNHEGFQWLVDAIHTFRMPAFFIVSGFFCFITFNKYGTKEFLQKRMLRIIIPLLVTAITLNTLQVYLLSEVNSATVQPLATKQYWLYGGWVSHLWFLLSLVLYFSMAIIMLGVARPLIKKIQPLVHWTMTQTKGAYLLLLPLFSYGFIFISYRLPVLEFNPYGIGFDVFLQYTGFFIFGLVLASNKQYIGSFIQMPKWWLGALVVGLYLMSLNLNLDSAINRLIAMYSTGLVSWILSAVCFWVFYQFFNKKSPFFSFYSDASYTIYLFHHILVIALGLLIVQIDLPAILEFTIIITLTFLVTSLIHKYLIKQIGFLRYLYNGKKAGEP